MTKGPFLKQPKEKKKNHMKRNIRMRADFASEIIFKVLKEKKIP